AGADPRIQEDMPPLGHPVLYKAIAHGHNAIVELLLSHTQGEIIEASAIHGATFFENVAAIHSIVTHSRGITERTNRMHQIFTHATCLGKLSFMELAIKLGANLERKDYQGQTAMITAVKYGRPDAVELLIKADASLWPKDPSGKSLLQIASSLEEPMAPGKMFTTALGVWFEEYPRAEALFGSAAFKEFLFDDSAHVEIIKTLIKSYADVEERTAAGESMLHLAVPSTPERVRVILETARDRFDVDALDDDGRTHCIMPLPWAKQTQWSCYLNMEPTLN
ncbi:MAG: hypothetical protein Q9181_008361, partial [Wetmoreana brouardii]